ncbi:hypothetical protein ACP4J4_08550 [Aureimonas ureilytica]|uniref:thermonuclease family protein n=1 Tax=Aureimonas ureilytica TaxID=401562 RepID=UPI003CEC4308
MQAFRIALGLCALLLAWMFLLPPAALGPVERETAEARPVATPAVTASPAPASAPVVETEEAAAAPVRTIGPVAVEIDGALQRLPAVASGAAEPPIAERPAQVAQAEAMEAAPAPAETVAASPTPDAPQVRRLPAPIALDTGTIRSGEETIQIAGIAPIAPETRCADGPRSWPCGVRARTEFRAWLRGRTLTCDPADAATPDAPTACRLGEEDVGDWLVRNGWANAEPGSRYEREAQAARQAGRGVWQFEVTRQGAVQ